MEKVLNLSRRLKAAADLVRTGSVTADVGCDHGKLSAHLLLSGRAEFVYATDIRKQPLEKAAALLSSEDLKGRYECVLTDGLQGLPGERITDVVIAGVGDDVTEKIMSDAVWLRDPEKNIVLVPSSRHERVREFLAGSGFSTVSERAVYEHGHLYTVICAAYTGEKRQLDIRDKWLGRIDPGEPEGERYLAWILRRMRAIADSIADPEHPSRREAEEVIDSLSDL